MNRTLKIFVFFFLPATHGFSQNGYFSKDSTIFSGVNLIGGSVKDNCQFIKVVKNNAIITYTPNDLKEYGFEDGTFYMSKTISINGADRKVFLQRVRKGNTSLYYYTSSDFEAFYVEAPNKNLIELVDDKQHDYKKVLSEYMDSCLYMATDIRLVRFKKNSLVKLFTYYEQCTPRPFPYIKIGLLVGYGNTYLSLPQEYNGPVSSTSWRANSNGISFGAFIDSPIASSYWSMNAGLVFSKNGYSTTKKNQNTETDIVINFISIDAPLLIRYTLPVKNLRPFFNGGGILSYHVKNTSNIYQAVLNQSVIMTSEIAQDNLVSDQSLGLSIGSGIQQNINFKNTLSVELRFNKFFSSPDYLQKNAIFLLTSFTF